MPLSSSLTESQKLNSIVQICLFLVFVATVCLVCEIVIKKCWRRTYKINSKSLFIFCFYQKTSSHVHLCVRFNRYLCCLVWHLLCVVCMIKESSFWRKDLLLTGQGLQIPIFSVQRDLTACLSMSLFYSVVLLCTMLCQSAFDDDRDFVMMMILAGDQTISDGIPANFSTSLLTLLVTKRVLLLSWKGDKVSETD